MSSTAVAAARSSNNTTSSNSSLQSPSLTDILPTDTITKILSYVEPAETIRSVSCCNRALLQITSDRSFWSSLLLGGGVNPPPSSSSSSCPPSPSLSLSLSSLTTKQIQQCVVVARKRSKSLLESKNENGKSWFKMHIIDHIWPISLLPSREEAVSAISRNRGRYCLYSTRDRNVEVIENVLTENLCGYNWLAIFYDNHNDGDGDGDRDDNDEQNENGNDTSDSNNSLLRRRLRLFGSTQRFQSLNDAESNRWWSSAPSVKSRPEDTNEVLLFTFSTTIHNKNDNDDNDNDSSSSTRPRSNANVNVNANPNRAIVTEVAIKPLIEPGGFMFNHNGGRTVYSWPRISIQVFDLPAQRNDGDNNDDNFHNPMLITNERVTTMMTAKDSSQSQPQPQPKDWMRGTNQRPVIDALLQNQTPTYASPVMEATSTDHTWQYYSIPDGVVGNVVVITLWGKTFEQFQQSGYYVCVDKLSVRGVPLIH